MSRRRDKPPLKSSGSAATRSRKTRASSGAPESKRLGDDDLVASIGARAKGRSLEVHELEGVRVRTWASPEAECVHASWRLGLPTPLQPGTRHGRFEAGMRVDVRLPSPSELAGSSSPEPARRRGRLSRGPRRRGPP